jgi:hypothetical protein
MENLTLIATALGLAIDSTADVIVSAITALNQKVTDLTLSSKASTDSVNAVTASLNAIDVTVANAAGMSAKVTALTSLITDLKNSDATDKTIAAKDKDKIDPVPVDESDSYDFNVAADKFLGK